jgi:hypothetical protein
MTTYCRLWGASPPVPREASRRPAEWPGRVYADQPSEIIPPAHISGRTAFTSQLTAWGQAIRRAAAARVPASRGSPDPETPPQQGQSARTAGRRPALRRREKGRRPRGGPAGQPASAGYPPAGNGPGGPGNGGPSGIGNPDGTGPDCNPVPVQDPDAGNEGSRDDKRRWPDLVAFLAIIAAGACLLIVGHMPAYTLAAYGGFVTSVFAVWRRGK